MEYNTSKLNNNLNLDIDIVEIKNSNNYKIKFYTYGGYIHEVHIPTFDDPEQTEDVILGYGSLEGIIQADGYFNSIIGRVCNRIGKSKFTINNKEYELYSNTPPDHLHGGKEGFNKKIWKIEDVKKEKNSIRFVLNYFSKHLDENYPGNLNCKTIYELNNNNEFFISFEAFTDEDTIVNLTNHNYWNFHGHKDFYQNITDHYVKIDSSFICENDEFSIPTGKILNVNGTKFDLKKYFLIDDIFLEKGGIDNNYSILNKDYNISVAEIYSIKTGMGVEYFTNQPGIQFYTGNMMNEKLIGKYNKNYGIQYGMCLETQNFPDAINNYNFPSPILKKGETYKSFTKIKLRNDFIKINKSNEN